MRQAQLLVCFIQTRVAANLQNRQTTYHEIPFVPLFLSTLE